MDYTNASGDVIKVGGMDPNQFRRKEEPLDPGGFAQDFFWENLQVATHQPVEHENSP